MSKAAISVPEAAAQLGVGTSTLWNFVWAGQIRTIQVGRRRLIPLQAFEAFLAGTDKPEAGNDLDYS